MRMWGEGLDDAPRFSVDPRQNMSNPRPPIRLNIKEALEPVTNKPGHREVVKSFGKVLGCEKSSLMLGRNAVPHCVHITTCCFDDRVLLRMSDTCPHLGSHLLS